jgi:hypothetical protein
MDVSRNGASKDKVMGREIRKVPENHQHPKRRCHHSPWAGGCDEAKSNGGQCYKPLHDDEMPTGDWFQVYETLSEGTPVSPPFAVQEDLIKYLVANGDFWNQQRGEGGWSEIAARNFVKKTQWAPSAIRVPSGKLMSGVEGLVET